MTFDEAVKAFNALDGYSALPDYMLADVWTELPPELKIKNFQWIERFAAALATDPDIESYMKSRKE